MLTITKNGVSEPLIDYNGLEITEEVNGDFSLSFTSFFSDKNAHAYPLLTEESIVEFEEHEFRVKKLKETRNRKVVNYAQHIFFDLIDTQVYTINGGTKTLDEAVSFVLSGTGWTFENIGISYSVLLPNFGEDNALALIRAICEAFECEVKIEPNKHLKFMKQIGKDDDFQFRFKHNIKTLTRDVDTSKLATVIKGYGGNGLEVTYTSPNASVFGERHAEPVKDDRFTVAESLTERIRRDLIDYPEVTIEIEEVDLGEKGLGDKVWLIYEPLGIEFQTRVMARKRQPKQKGKNTSTLGNRKRTFSDILTETRVEIDRNNKQHRSRFEQTNERITMEVERLDEGITGAKSQFQIEADNIKSRVEEVETESVEYADLKKQEAIVAANLYTDGEVAPAFTRITDAESEINQMANEINSRVKETVYIADQATMNSKIDDVDGDLSSLGTRVYTAESKISQQATQISQRVSYTDYNGDTIVSKINQDAYSYTIDAKNIDLLGITNVNDTLFIGENWQDSTTKNIFFRGTGGGVGITSAKTDWLEMYALNSLTLSATGGGGLITLDANEIKLDSRVSTFDFSNANVIGVNYASSAGNADTLDGYHASSFSRNGHVHYDYASRYHDHDGDYVRDSFGQNIGLYQDNSTGRIVVTRNGSSLGSLSWN
jgi:phage minor structural protein